MKTILGDLASATSLGWLPVRVRRGAAKGAKWTLAPFSDYWRSGEGEGDVKVGLTYLKKIEGSVFWDIGAHYGIHTVGVAMQVGVRGQIAAFEPDPTAFRRLAHHVAKNRLDNVKLFQAAASDKPGELELFFPFGRAGKAASHCLWNEADDMGNTPRIQIKAIAIDDLVRTANIRAPDLIKVDVQGHGAKALTGALETIKANRPIILFSNHSEAEGHGTRDILSPIGYSPFLLSGHPSDWGCLQLILPAEIEPIRQPCI